MKRSRIQSVFCAFICIVFLATTVGGAMVSNAAEESTNVAPAIVECTGETVSTCRTQGMAPVFDGMTDRVFAGFYEDNACENPLTKDEILDATGDTKYFAKFVAKEVLDVKCRLTMGTMMDSEKTDLCLLSTVDSLHYYEVGFKVEIGDVQRTLASASVYETIYGCKDDSDTAEVLRPEEVFSTESAYFMTYKFTDFPYTAYDTSIKVTPQWTTLDGIVVTGAEKTFTVEDIIYTYQNDKYNPEHNYMEYIQGEEYEFFITPYSAEVGNSVAWDEELQAYHLVNKCTSAGLDRGFLFDAEYLARVMKYTDAEKLTFEVRNDGVQSGIKDVVSGVYDWIWTGYNTASNKAIYTNVDVCDWRTYTFELADMPKDEAGNIIPFFIMHESQGMYVRNIRLLMADGYDPNHDYTESITGEAYEFIISPNSTENSVEWDEAKQAYHLKNLTTSGGNGRAFIFDVEYLVNVMKYTDAETLTFELQNDGELVANGQQYDYLYQAYDMAWGAYDWTGYHPEIRTYEVELKLADMINEDGTFKAFTVMHSRQGMYVGNIKLCRADGSDLNHSYEDAIQGEECEFFISPNDSSTNSVEWDETKQAFHLINKSATQGNGRAFLFNAKYLANVIKYTDAEVLTFELQNDGELIENGFAYDYMYKAYDMQWGALDWWTGYHPAIMDWAMVEINLADIPKNDDGTLKSFSLMHTTQGMYVRNIKLCRADGSELGHNYLEYIQGEDYEFFFNPVNTATNSVEWDETEQVFHLINKHTSLGMGRAFVLDKAYLGYIMKYTDAKMISLEIRNDGVQSGVTGGYDNIHYGYWNVEGATLNGGLTHLYWTKEAINEWKSVTFNLADMVDANGNIQPLLLMHEKQGMQVRNIKLLREDGSDPNHDYAEAIQGEEYEFFISPNSTDNSVEWDETKQAFHLVNKHTSQGNGRAFIFDAEYLANVMKYTDAEVLTFELQNDGELIENGFAYDYMYKAYDMQWGALDWWTGYHPEIMDWATVEIKLADIPKNDDGTLKAFTLMHARQGMYVRNITIK